jgi:hypothetical protein
MMRRASPKRNKSDGLKDGKGSKAHRMTAIDPSSE